MTETVLPPAAVGTAYTSDHAWDLLTALSDVEDRMAGSPGEARAASLVADAFREAGLREVSTPEFPVHRWTRGTSSVESESESSSANI